jgi:hypothetical protein
VGALVLGIAAQPSRAQSDWPPDDDGPAYQVPPQQDYPPETQQPGTNQQYGYAQPYANQPYETVPGYQAQPEYGTQPGYAVQPLTADRLSQLVAPIALYPDALVAQILTAATYPAQISAADQWLRQMQGAPAEQIAAAANAQANWDPSIKALTAFPDILAILDQNLQWTSELGNAYYNQPQDVLATVQMLRGNAQQAGNLQPVPQEQITDNQGYIAIAPANPQTVYVPTYDPWTVYGQPINPYPGFSFAGELGSFVGTGVQYGVGFMINPWLNFTFGIASWGMDWLGNAILFNHGAYWTHSHEMHDWGYRNGGPRWGGYGRGGYGRGGYGGREFARFGGAYNHQPINVHGGGGWNARGGNYPPMHSGYGGSRDGEYSRANGGQFALNRMPAEGGHPMPYRGGTQAFPGQGYNRPAYGGGSGFARPGGGYTGGNTYLGFRGGYGHMPSQPVYGGASARSGGYSVFGGGHVLSYGGGSHAFSGGGSHSFFGGGRSYGGSSHSFSGGSHSFGGGGHSFGGGGHSFGGGHSGGGHSGGGGHGGHHGR